MCEHAAFFKATGLHVYGSLLKEILGHTDSLERRQKRAELIAEHVHEEP